MRGWTTTRTIAVLVVLALVAGIIWVVSRNSVAEGGGVDTDRHEVDHYEGGTEEVPLAFVHASGREPKMTTEQRHKVARWRGRSRTVPLAAPGCEAIVTKDDALNRDDEPLFGIQVRAVWCWRNGKRTMTEFTRDFWAGGEWWNLYKLRKWKEPVRTLRPKYAYNRQGAWFEACAAGSIGCFLDSEVWLSQTVRVGGTYSTDWKGK